jgi:diguanylate cyclase (GGDEF)-like protein
MEPSVKGIFLSVIAGLSLCDAIDSYALRPEAPITATIWLWLVLVDVPMPILAWLLVHTQKQRDHLMVELERLSVTDQLTGVFNRRGFVERAVLAISQARRSQITIAILMFDLDHFKAVNDGYGHAAGDAVLRNFASVLSARRRSGDLVGRLGGEEFAVMLFDSTIAQAACVADRLRIDVSLAVQHPGGADKRITVSGGIALVPLVSDPETALFQAISAADQGLYVAKETGRDQIMSSAAANGTRRSA